MKTPSEIVREVCIALDINQGDTDEAQLREAIRQGVREGIAESALGRLAAPTEDDYCAGCESSIGSTYVEVNMHTALGKGRVLLCGKCAAPVLAATMKVGEKT